jgi:hypothetical protein
MAYSTVRGSNYLFLPPATFCTSGSWVPGQDWGFILTVHDQPLGLHHADDWEQMWVIRRREELVDDAGSFQDVWILAQRICHTYDVRRCMIMGIV